MSLKDCLGGGLGAQWSFSYKNGAIAYSGGNSRILLDIRSIRLHHVVGGSTSPGCSQMCFDLNEIQIYLAKMTQISSGISAAI